MVRTEEVAVGNTRVRLGPVRDLSGGRARAALPNSQAQRGFVQLVVPIVVASCFGPYVVPGVRTEQLACYALAIIALLAGIVARKSGPRSGLGMLRPVAFSWFVYSAWTLVASIDSDSMLAPVAKGSLFAGADNLLLPLATIALMWPHLRLPSERPYVTLLVCRWIVVFACLNSLLSLVMVKFDLMQLLRPFWGADDGRQSVAELASQLGRLSGVFNQPAEAGLMYSLAAISAVHAFGRQRLVLTLSLLLITIGGSLSVTKTFLLIGLPIVMLTCFKRRELRSSVLLGLCVILGATISSGLVSAWNGAAYLARLTDVGNASLLNLYTAGRLTSDSSISKVIDMVSEYSPLSGFGAGGLLIPYDNGWVEAYVVAGTIGVVLYTAALATICFVAVTSSGEHRWLARATAVVVVATSVGLPGLTTNRAGTLAWLLIACCASMCVHTRLLVSPHKEGA